MCQSLFVLSRRTMQACNVILNSSLTLSRSNPLSKQMIVVCRMVSSKHWEYNSRLTFQNLTFLCNSLLKIILPDKYHVVSLVSELVSHQEDLSNIKPC